MRSYAFLQSVSRSWLTAKLQSGCFFLQPRQNLLPAPIRIFARPSNAFFFGEPLLAAAPFLYKTRRANSHDAFPFSASPYLNAKNQYA